VKTTENLIDEFFGFDNNCDIESVTGFPKNKFVFI